MASNANRNDPLFTRGLPTFPTLTPWMCEIHEINVYQTTTLQGDLYSDGAAYDTTQPSLRHAGWAIVQLPTPNLINGVAIYGPLPDPQ